MRIVLALGGNALLGRGDPMTAWRRVVPSPEPRRILEVEPITWLLERGAVVICAGGGGIPTMYPSSGPGALLGVEAVIGKDLASGQPRAGPGRELGH
jgi:carbamate kinase